MPRGKDRKKRVMHPRSLANLAPFPQSRPDGMERVEVDVFLHPDDAKTWRKLTPAERGEWIRHALEMRSRG